MPRKNRRSTEFVYQLFSLVLIVIVVHAAYVGVIRPSADAILARQSLSMQADATYVAERSLLVLIRDYIEEREREVEAYNAERDFDASVRANGRRLTNLGTFRKYVEAYVRAHPLITDEMTLLVRHLQPTPERKPQPALEHPTDSLVASRRRKGAIGIQ